MSNVISKTAVATEPPEIIYVATKRVACDGGSGGAAIQSDGRSAPGGALGHPRVYLEMGEEDRVECGYCDRLYVYRPDHAG
jgi:uncharacterized Zn-finger protein